MKNAAKTKQNKPLIILTAALLVCAAVFAYFYQGAFMPSEVDSYPDGDGFYFRDERVMQIDLRMAADELSDMTQNYSEKKLHKAQVTIDGFDYGYIGVRTRGSGALEYYTVRESGCYPLELRLDYYNKNSAYNGISRINLNNRNTGYTNFYVFNTLLATRMYEALDVPVSDCCLAFVTLNGVDFGLYTAVEEVDRSFIEKQYGETGGTLYKSCDDNGDYYSEMLHDVRVKFAGQSSKKICDEFLNTSEILPQVDEYVNTDETLRYLAASAAIMNSDSLTKYAKNFYFYYTNGKLDVIPWDFDHTFSLTDGVLGAGDVTYSLGFLFLKKMIESEENRDIFLNYIRQVTNECLSPEIIVPYIDKLTAMADAYLKRDRTCTMLYDVWREAADNKEGIYTLLAEQYRQIMAQLDGEADSYENTPQTEQCAQYEQTVAPRRERPHAGDALNEAIAAGGHSESAQEEKASTENILPALLIFAAAFACALLFRTSRTRKVRIRQTKDE